MARRAIKAINWAAISERVPETDRTVFAAFKSRSDQYLRRVSELPEAPVKIDWALYKKEVPVPGMVEKFQKEYEALNIPYPADTYTKALEEEEKKIMEDVKKWVEDSNKRIDEFKAEAEKIRGLLPFEQMTMEDFAEAYPEHAINIDKPTIWPHDPEIQPKNRDIPEPMPKPDH